MTSFAYMPQKLNIDTEAAIDYLFCCLISDLKEQEKIESAYPGYFTFDNAMRMSVDFWERAENHSLDERYEWV